MWITRAKWEWLKTQIDYSDKDVSWLRSRLAKSEHELTVARDSDQATARSAWDAIANARTAQLEASMLRVQVNELRLERAALLTRLLPGLTLQVPQVGKLDVTAGPPGSDFEDLGDLAEADEIPLSNAPNAETIADVIGVDDESPALQPGTVVRPPSAQ